MDARFTVLAGVIAEALGRGDVAAAREVVLDMFDRARQPQEEASAWFWRGVLHDAEKRWDAAEESFLMSLSIFRKVYGDVHSTVAHCVRSLALVHARDGRVLDAAEMFLVAYESFPDAELMPSLEILALAGTMFIRAGKVGRALLWTHHGIERALHADCGDTATLTRLRDVVAEAQAGLSSWLRISQVVSSPAHDAHILVAQVFGLPPRVGATLEFENPDAVTCKRVIREVADLRVFVDPPPDPKPVGVGVDMLEREMKVPFVAWVTPLET